MQVSLKLLSEALGFIHTTTPVIHAKVIWEVYINFFMLTRSSFFPVFQMNGLAKLECKRLHGEYEHSSVDWPIK